MWKAGRIKTKASFVQNARSKVIDQTTSQPSAWNSPEVKFDLAMRRHQHSPEYSIIFYLFTENQRENVGAKLSSGGVHRSFANHQENDNENQSIS